MLYTLNWHHIVYQVHFNFLKNGKYRQTQGKLGAL